MLTNEKLKKKVFERISVVYEGLIGPIRSMIEADYRKGRVSL